jgi:hypothetical protein
LEPILTKYRAEAASALQAETTAAANKRNVTIDDKARVLHLFADPNKLKLISDAYASFDRPTLDDKKSHDDSKILVYNEFMDFEGMLHRVVTNNRACTNAHFQVITTKILLTMLSTMESRYPLKATGQLTSIVAILILVTLSLELRASPICSMSSVL